MHCAAALGPARGAAAVSSLSSPPSRFPAAAFEPTQAPGFNCGLPGSSGWRGLSCPAHRRRCYWSSKGCRRSPWKGFGSIWWTRGTYTTGRWPSLAPPTPTTRAGISRTILLSVISLLNEPNTFSPANVDASVMYRKWKESKGKDREYTDIIRKQVLGTKVDAERDGVKVPTTLAEYCVKTKTPAPDEGSDLFYDDYYEDDEMEEEADSCYGDEDDSGNEES
uniref:Cell division cycle 34, ubiqiutin conjugating enzyme n=1 Tax=Meleagris gallopavo TaxID=9103 RepID=A0A803YF25_MELGA